MRELKYKNGTTQVQPARYTTPHHYQERLATHLRKLEAEGVVERAADPTQAGEQEQGHHQLPEDGAGQTRLHGLPSRPRGPQAPGPQIGRAEGRGHEEEQPDWGSQGQDTGGKLKGKGRGLGTRGQDIIRGVNNKAGGTGRHGAHEAGGAGRQGTNKVEDAGHRGTYKAEGTE